MYILTCIQTCIHVWHKHTYMTQHVYLLKVADKLTKIYGSRMYNYYDEQCFQNYEGN